MINTMNFKVSHLLVVSSIILMYFQVYWHYWLVKLLGGYIINTCLPIVLLFAVFIIRELVSRSTTTVKKRKVYYLLLPLICYIFFASVSIILNEQDIRTVISYHIYIYSPVIIFVSILSLHMYRSNKNIKSTLNILLIVGVIFSIYVTIMYSVYYVSVRDAAPLQTSRGFELSANTGASFGHALGSAIRYTIPGISSTTYGPMLVPLILGGLYIRRHTGGKQRYLYIILISFLILCVIKTVSRGPLLALIVGIAYLIWWRWFRWKAVVFIALISTISLLTFAKLSFFRLFTTFTDLIHSGMVSSEPVLSGTVGKRLVQAQEALVYIYQHPFLGIGMTNLQDIQRSSYGKVHNNYLSIGASFGVLTLMFYISFIILFFVMLHKSIKKMPINSAARDMGIVLSAGSLALIVYLNAAPAEFHFIWVWFGLAAAWARNSEIEYQEKRN